MAKDNAAEELNIFSIWIKAKKFLWVIFLSAENLSLLLYFNVPK